MDRLAPYSVPADNPFVMGGGRPEIWAYGLRNPWRWSFDRETGDLWLADVGQRVWEEIDVVVKGGNYGWNIREGAHDFRRASPGSGPGPLIEPVAEYSHRDGCSVTGGFVYRGRKLPTLRGNFIYGDFCNGNVWATRLSANGTGQTEKLFQIDARIGAFAQGNDGELYILDHASGRILALVPG